MSNKNRKGSVKVTDPYFLSQKSNRTSNVKDYSSKKIQKGGNTQSKKTSQNISSSIVKFSKKLPSLKGENPNNKLSKWERTDIQVNEVLKDIFKEANVHRRDGSKAKFHSGVSPLEGFHLYDLVLQNSMSKVLEVGMAYGTSALYICQALKDSTFKKKGKSTKEKVMFSIDPNQSEEWENIGILNLERADLSKYHRLIKKPSYIALAELLKCIEENSEPSFDLIFVDGMHLFDYTLVDIFFSVRMLRIGGVLVIDDIKHSGVKQAIDYITQNYGSFLELKKETPCSKTAATFVKINNDKRKWNYHTHF